MPLCISKDDKKPQGPVMIILFVSQATQARITLNCTLSTTSRIHMSMEEAMELSQWWRLHNTLQCTLSHIRNYEPKIAHLFHQELSVLLPQLPFPARKWCTSVSHTVNSFSLLWTALRWCTTSSQASLFFSEVTAEENLPLITFFLSLINLTRCKVSSSHQLAVRMRFLGDGMMCVVFLC